MTHTKNISIVLITFFLLTGCGGNDSEVSSGGGSDGEVSSGVGSEDTSGTVTQRACTGDDLKGDWRITAMVGPLSETQIVAFDGSESPGSNVIDATRDGITLMGTIEPSCDAASGTATDGNLSGTFTAVKIS